MRKVEDEEGNPWYKQGQLEDRINHGVRGSHASIPFQCESCWMINLESRLPREGLDDLYVACIRRANLDASGGLAVSTIAGKASSIKRTIGECNLIHRTPFIEPRGPMPMEDCCGMGMAVEMILHSVTARPRLKDQKFIQFDSMRKLRSVYTSAWESSPRGILEGSTFTMGTSRVTVTSCPTQQRWFSLFIRGAEVRMGYAAQRNLPFGAGVILRLLELVKEEINSQSVAMAREYTKLGAAIALALCASLRGPEVFLLDLAGLREHIGLGRDGILPPDPMRAGVGLTAAPHVVVTLLGQFKGELGTRKHQIALASVTMSGIELRWWMEQLVEVRRQEGWRTGPAFGDRAGRAALLSEYDGMMLPLLLRIQATDPNLIAPSDDVERNYSFFRSFRRTATGRARAAGLDESVQTAMNRWRIIEQAKGRRPRFNMVEHYTHARDLMPVTWRYSYVQ